MIRLAWLTLGCAALTFGCGPAVSLEADTDSDEGSSSAGSTTDSVGSASSTPPNTTAPGTTTGPIPTTGPGTTTMPTATDPTFGSDSSGFGSSGGSTSFVGSSGFMESGSSSSGGIGLPDGAECMNGAQCSSEACYLAGALGGICGECSDDADCDFGCNSPNPLASPPQGSTCSAGNLGENCETEAACAGALECVSVVNIPGIISISSCSECDTNADCLPGNVCNIELDISEFGGVWTCTPTGTVPLGGTCDLPGSGDAACASGICAAGSVQGLLTLGICSECDAGSPCGAGQTCLEPEVGLDGTIVPGTCV